MDTIWFLLNKFKYIWRVTENLFVKLEALEIYFASNLKVVISISLFGKFMLSSLLSDGEEPTRWFSQHGVLECDWEVH